MQIWYKFFTTWCMEFTFSVLIGQGQPLFFNLTSLNWVKIKNNLCHVFMFVNSWSYEPFEIGHLLNVWNRVIMIWKTLYYQITVVLKLQAKGQLISKCLCEKIVSTKIPTKKFDRFWPASFIQTRYVNYALIWVELPWK